VFKKKPGVVEIGETEPQWPPKLSEILDHVLKCETGALDEQMSKRILAECGIETVMEKIASDEDNAAFIAAQCGFPVVLKGLVPGKMHKTEEGLVRLGLRDESEVRQAYRSLSKKMDENVGIIVVQRQVPEGIELIAGLIRDHQFGTCVMCGIGGTMAEVIQDSVFAAAPLEKCEAMSLIGRLKNRKLLDGFRGFPPVDREQLANIIVRLGGLGDDYSRIGEIDVNPLIATETGLVAVDAAIVMADPSAATQQ
jgi:acetyltransferase